ncbi:hypothetical protein ACJMK2_003882 [Sinanodonta woodiana]|uniref:B box-type domain-containing protein n=1 Tax=Sinanodonta woodiana TaxID=1069815 RepID=A0ABD3Y1G4_SINWO
MSLSYYAEKRRAGCKVCGPAIRAPYFCIECRELYCEGCKEFHSKMKVSLGHSVIDIYIRPNCSLCETQANTSILVQLKLLPATSRLSTPARYVCVECDDCYCESCAGRHLKMKCSTNHMIVDLTNLNDRRVLRKLRDHQC